MVDGTEAKHNAEDLTDNHVGEFERTVLAIQRHEGDIMAHELEIDSRRSQLQTLRELLSTEREKLKELLLKLDPDIKFYVGDHRSCM